MNGSFYMMKTINPSFVLTSNLSMILEDENK